MKLLALSRYAAVLALLCVGLFACGRKEEGGKVQVQIFITTKGGESIKLGNVLVYGLSKDYVVEVAEKLNQPVVLATCTIKKRVIDAEIQALRVAKETSGAYAAATYANTKLDALREVRDYYDYRNNYIFQYLLKNGGQHIPTTFKPQRTDADGRVGLWTSQKYATYYILASTERTVGDEIKRYYWLVLGNPQRRQRLPSAIPIYGILMHVVRQWAFQSRLHCQIILNYVNDSQTSCSVLR